MIDPEIDYRRIVSGNAAVLTGAADTLADIGHDLDDACGRIHDAAATTDWSGPAAIGFQTRITQLADGVSVDRTDAARAREAFDVAVTAQATAMQQADHYISFWRNRPGDIIEIFEIILGMVVRARLVEVATTYSQQLTAVAAVLKGEHIDLDSLDEETRAWVKQGLEKNEEWAEESGSTFGPLIPHTAATGDERGLTPQGLAYDPRTGTYVMSSYTDDDHDGPATLTLVDSVTGQEIGEVNLAGSKTSDGPAHAGGVSVQGDDVIVVDKHRIYTYSMSDIRSQPAGAAVIPSYEQEVDDGGSYCGVHGGKLYLGDYEHSKLYVYEKSPSGKWKPVRDAAGIVEVHDTSSKVQGVVVRDEQFVFSTSPNRLDEGSLIAQDRTSDDRRSAPYTLPNMAEGVVEVDGQFVTTYESTARQYDDDDRWFGWVPGPKDDDDLWANPYLTMTPLAALDLSADFTVQSGTLRQASHALDRPSRQLSTASSTVGGVRVRADDLGEVPGAGAFASAVTTLLDAASDSLRTGSKAVALVSDHLTDSARDYSRTDEVVGTAFGRLAP